MTEGCTPKPSEALERLRNGEISLDGYLDFRADDAVQHLKGLLSAERLAFVRNLIREELTSDPVLVELVRCATGLDPRTASVR